MLDQAAITEKIRTAASVVESLVPEAQLIESIVRAVGSALGAGYMVFTCGNGGSAAEALHLAEEMVGRYRADRPPLAGLSLNADPTAITCIANDFGYEQIFARQLEALGHEGDLLVVFSTSGNSPNVLAVLETARQRAITTIGLLGSGGGKARLLCDLALVVDSDRTEHIQEAHQVVLHLILESVEAALTDATDGS